MSYEHVAGYYDRLMEDMPYEQWKNFVKSSWDRFGKPRTAVDLGCGTGTITLFLAECGVDVRGIDLSPDMLAVAREKEQRRRRNPSFAGKVQWLEQDMRDWTVGEQVDAVYSWCDCMNYLLEESDVERTIRATYRQLGSGGVFLFDMLVEEQFLRYEQQQPFVLDEEDLAYIWHCEYDRERKQIEHDLTLFVAEEKTGMFRRVEESHRQRAYSPDWVLDALRKAGFRHVSCTAAFSWRPVEPGRETERLFFSAVKPQPGNT